MKCFTHGQADAVAVCRSCGRALCHECSADVDGKCACAGRCEERVRGVEKLIDQNMKAYERVAKTYDTLGVAIALIGFLVTVPAAVAALFPAAGEASLWNWVPVATGMVFFTLGMLIVRAGRRYAKP